MRISSGLWALFLFLFVLASSVALSAEGVNLSQNSVKFEQVIGVGAGLTHATTLYNKFIMPSDDNFDTLRLHTLNIISASYEIADDHFGFGGTATFVYYDQHDTAFVFAPGLTIYSCAYLKDIRESSWLNPFITLTLGITPQIIPGVGLGCRMAFTESLSLKLTGIRAYGGTATADLQFCFCFGWY